jgi:signal transduction histidine kinase
MTTWAQRLKGWAAKVWPQRIWQQIFWVLLFLAVVPLVILGALLINTSQQAVRTTVLRDHKELAYRAAGQVNEFVRKPKDLLVTAASIMGVSHADAWRQETAVVELSLRFPMLRRVASIDIDGHEIAVSQLGSAKLDRSSDVAFLRAREGKTFISTVKIRGMDTPVVTIAVPITQWGKGNGVLMAEVDLRGMWDIVDSIHVGRTGYACVVDRSGALISHPNKKMILGHEPLFSSGVVADVLSGKGGSQEEVDAQGGKWIASYAPVQDTGWGILIFQSTTEAYAFSKVMKAQAWSFILLVMLAAFIISMALARFMSRPLNMLLEGARRISQRDYDHPLPVAHQDEIGQILSSFNDMMAKLRQARQAEKLSLIGKAVTSIVHELKNSLVLVDTYIQLLGERYKEKQFIQEFTRVVPQELNAWKGMLQNMVEYARVPHFALEPVDVNALVKDVALLADYRVKQHGAGFVVEADAGMPPVHGNAEKLRQVLMNLLSNALDSMTLSGTVRLIAIVGEHPSHTGRSFVVISVENTGEVISPERLERIFEPFFTTKDGGLGLGLAICREIVERHGGFIDVTSGPEKKTSFRVHLPLDNGGL